MTRRGDKLTAALTGKGREVGPEEAHYRTVKALGARIAGKERRLREARATAKRLQRELRADRRELRLVLQRKSDVTIDELEIAGKADGTDRAIAHAENPVSHARSAGPADECPLGSECGWDRNMPCGVENCPYPNGRPDVEDLRDVFYPTRPE